MVLLPLAWVFWLVVATRRFLYSLGLFKSYKVGAPVIIVGNISVGGTGKTPATIWLAEQLKELGEVPGIVSRGYMGDVGSLPAVVQSDSDPAIVGDEAILLATRTRCPVVVHPDRVAAARKVVELGANVVISDDGLQHYRLVRDIEIVVTDTSRGFGNGKLLPAGPLRESVSRLKSVDKIFVNRDYDSGKEFLESLEDRSKIDFRLSATTVHRVDQLETRGIKYFTGKQVHAVAGIGNPERFFRMLEEYGIKVLRHPLSDHANISRSDIEFDDGLDVLMTEKDAVKCRQFNNGDCWYVAVDISIDTSESVQFMDLVHSKVQLARAKIS